MKLLRRIRLALYRFDVRFNPWSKRIVFDAKWSPGEYFQSLNRCNRTAPPISIKLLSPDDIDEQIAAKLSARREAAQRAIKESR